MVPVVYGAEDVHKVAPPHSYIDVRDFKSPKHLAEYLLYLDKTDEEYMSYLKWREFYEVNGAHGIDTAFCRLCSYVTENNGPKVVHDFRDWFFEKGKAKPLPFTF